MPGQIDRMFTHLTDLNVHFDKRPALVSSVVVLRGLISSHVVSYQNLSLQTVTEWLSLPTRQTHFYLQEEEELFALFVLFISSKRVISHLCAPFLSFPTEILSSAPCSHAVKFAEMH